MLNQISNLGRLQSLPKPKGSTKTSGSPCQLDTLVPNVVTRNFILNIVPLRSGAYGEDDNLALALLVRVRR